MKTCPETVKNSEHRHCFTDTNIDNKDMDIDIDMRQRTEGCTDLATASTKWLKYT